MDERLFINPELSDEERCGLMFWEIRLQMPTEVTDERIKKAVDDLIKAAIVPDVSVQIISAMLENHPFNLDPVHFYQPHMLVDDAQFFNWLENKHGRAWLKEVWRWRSQSYLYVPNKKTGPCSSQD